LKIAFIDTETTGINPKENGLVQIACIVTENGEELGTFNHSVCTFEKDLITLEALQVTGLTEQEIKSFPDPISAHRSFTDFLCQFVDKFDKADKMIFSGYNAKFDQDFLREWFHKCGDNYFGSFFWSPPMDVMSLAISKLMDKRPGMLNFKLGTVAQEMGIALEAESLHDALYDIRTTIKIYDCLKGSTIQ